jgi:hypothetical protein
MWWKKILMVETNALPMWCKQIKNASDGVKRGHSMNNVVETNFGSGMTEAAEQPRQPQ